MIFQRLHMVPSKKYHAILTSSSTAERNFKALNLQWTKNRNRLKASKACDLAFIATNLAFLKRCEEADKRKRMPRKRKAAAAPSSYTEVPAEEFDDGPWIEIENLDFNVIEEQLEEALENFDADDFDVQIDIELD